MLTFKQITEEKHYVVMTGGSLGDQGGSRKRDKKGRKIVSTEKSLADAKATAKRLNSRLSQGEKKYYKIKYSAVTEEKARDYRHEYDSYHAKPEQRRNRANRNQARAKMVKAGRASKGDGKDVDHISRNTNNNSDKNLRVVSVATNRGYDR